jgi:outer membrane lipoprotein-sorting protein
MEIKMAVIEKICCALFMVLTIPCSALTQERAANVDATEIVKKVDALYRSESSAGEMEMQIVTPNWERTLRMKVWTQGMNKTFIRILSPAKEKGVATLRIGNEMWNYLPNTNKVIKIPPSMMMSSWMGSDFTNDDLVSEFTLLEDFHYQLVTPDEARADLLYIESIPREDLPIVWGKIVTAVRRDNYIPVWEKYYDEKGNLMRVLSFKDIKTFGNRTIPATMELIPQNKEGHKTVIRYLTIEFDKKIDKEIFSLRNLQARN